MIKKNGIYTNYTGQDIPDIFNHKASDCCFFEDGEAHRRITGEMLDRVKSGLIVVTEYVDSPLGGTYYLSPISILN